MEIRSLQPADWDWSNALVARHFDSPRVVSRGRLHNAHELPGFVAVSDGLPVGLLLYRIDTDGLEVVVLIAERPREGIGRTLLDSARGAARSAGCSRVWLVTTNDNLPAQAFYQALGWGLVAVHRGEVARSRLLKPEIPETGLDGIPIDDELEFALDVLSAASNRRINSDGAPM